MPTSKTAFPAEIGECIHSPHCLLKGEQYGDELWIAEPTLDPHPSNDHLLQVTPYKSDYQIDLNGHTAVPVTITGYRKSQRWWIQQLLSEWSDDHGYRPWLVEQAQRRWCPGIFDANHFFTDRAIGPGGRSIELERDRSDWIRDGHGLLLPRIEADAMSDVELAEMFPESKLLRAQMFDLVRIPHMKPEDVRKRYFISLDPVLPRHATATLPQPVTNYSFPLRTIEEQTAVVAGTANAQQTVNGIGFNLHLDEIEEKSLDSDPNDLSAKIEKVLELIAPYGKVVGQVNPEATERVCFCIKQDHGDAAFFDKMNMDAFQKWLSHQNNLFDIQYTLMLEGDFLQNILLLESIIPMDFSLDSLVRNEASLRKIGTDINQCRVLWNDLRQAAAKNKKHIVDSIHMSCTGMMRFINLYLTKGMLHASQCFSLEHSTRAKMKHMIDEARSKNDIPNFVQLRKNDFQVTHQYAIDLLNSNIPIGGSGVLVLGGGHFISNNQDYFSRQYADCSTDVMNDSMEKCLAKDTNLKNMRCIIIEPTNYT